MLRIAVNTRVLLKNKLEGIGRFTHEICKRMVENNPDVEFHFLFDRPFHDSFIYGPNVIPHVLFPPARHPILWYLWFEWAIPKKLDQIRADCFLSPDGFLSLSTEVPSMLVTHDLAFEHYPEHIPKSHLRFLKKYSSRYHHKADKVACVSEYTRHDVIEAYNVPKEKTFVAYNSSSISIYSSSTDKKNQIKSKWTNGQDYFLYLGAIHPRKNVHRLIKAYELFKSKTSSQTKLIILGRMAWKTEAVNKAIYKSGYKDDIVSIPFAKDITPILGAAKCLCYPSLFEGFGIPILEAFHLAVPVITSNVTSMPEVAGEAAILVDPTDVKDMSSALERIDNDRLLRHELIKKGKKQKLKFSWDKSAEEIFTHLMSMCQ